MRKFNLYLGFFIGQFGVILFMVWFVLTFLSAFMYPIFSFILALGGDKDGIIAFLIWIITGVLGYWGEKLHSYCESQLERYWISEYEQVDISDYSLAYSFLFIYIRKETKLN